jgi:predicted RNase H-like nuclease (RuvC/YqgF family)
MEMPISRVAEEQRRALELVVGRLGLGHAPGAAERGDRIAELEATVTALYAENQELRAQVQSLEDQRYQLETELEALSRRRSWRLAPARIRTAEDER